MPVSNIDLRDKLSNENARMEDAGLHFAIALPVVLDAPFEVSQNGVTTGGLTANTIFVGTAGNLALEMAYTLNNEPVISFITTVPAGKTIRGMFKRVLSTSTLGNTTATNLTWASGQ